MCVCARAWCVHCATTSYWLWPFDLDAVFDAKKQPVTSYYWTDIGHKKQFSVMLCLCCIVQLCTVAAAASLFIWMATQTNKKMMMIIIFFLWKSKLLALFGLANRWNAWNPIRNRVREVVFTVYWIFINCVQ